MNAKPLDDLEMFELLQAAYPERFIGDDDDTWNEAMEFADNISGWDAIADLLGRVAMLTMPMKSVLTCKLTHCLGTVTISDDGSVDMTAAVRRMVE